MSEKKPKNKTRTLVIVIVIACLLLPIAGFGSYFAYLLYFKEDPTFQDVVIEEPVEEVDGDSGYKPIDIPDSEESGIDNIVLFGVDSRTAKDHGRTDSIIIATIDKNSKVVKLTSIMRDMYVRLGDTQSMNRINAAYVFGGPEMALKTLNNNFNLDLKYYAIIDFRAFQDLVDKLSGIDVEVKDHEVKEINKYIKSVNGSKATLLKGSGFQHLNGQQALSYARIRKVGNGDFERTERQRIVLKSLADKAKQVNILKIPSLLSTLVSYVHTNVPLSKIVSLGVTAYKFKSGIESMRVPVDGYYGNQNVNGSSVLVPDVKANAQLIREFIFGIRAFGDKDVPAYMQNNFHMDDELVASSSRPRANIPDYSTPDEPEKPEDEEELTPTPSETPTPTEPKPTDKPVVTPTDKPKPTDKPVVTPTDKPEPTDKPVVTPTDKPEPTPEQSPSPQG